MWQESDPDEPEHPDTTSLRSKESNDESEAATPRMIAATQEKGASMKRIGGDIRFVDRAMRTAVFEAFPLKHVCFKWLL